jgi:hypothetical protein
MPPLAALRLALSLLLQAQEYASELQSNAWDFAVDLGSLRESGLTNNDLRWLVYHDYLAHAIEVNGSGKTRAFCHHGNFPFLDRSCFILTESGAAFATSYVDGHLLTQGLHAATPPVARTAPVHGTPHWESRRRTLWLGPLVIKEFKVPAPNQEIILAAFEEEDWTLRIDDPLPPHPAIDAKRRLHDTINSLNRNQRNVALRFFGDGYGQGICWESAAGQAPTTRLNGEAGAPPVVPDPENGHCVLSSSVRRGGGRHQISTITPGSPLQ